MSGVSQNGYSFGDSSVIATYTVVRDVKISLRKGAASVLLLHWLRWYDKNIEPLTKADTGGYNPRTVAGSKVKSNHGSGTASDHRWNKRPRGKRTYNSTQRSKIRNQIKFYEGALRWGGDYVNATVDEMHVEINQGPAQIERIAKKCQGSSAPTKPVTAPKAVKEDGKLGPQTVALWQAVMHAKVTGVMTPTFTKTVQTKLRATVDHRLAVDGIGLAQNGHQYKTIGALQRYLGSPVDLVMSTPVSTVVKALQRRLNTGKF